MNLKRCEIKDLRSKIIDEPNAKSSAKTELFYFLAPS